MVASPAKVVSHCANGKLLVMMTDPRSYRCAIAWKKWLASSRENGR